MGVPMHRRRQWFSFLIVASSLIPAVKVEGQYVEAARSQISEGDSVRVQFPGGLPIDGVVAQWRENVMMLNIVGLAVPWPVSVHEVDKLRRLLRSDRI